MAVRKAKVKRVMKRVRLRRYLRVINVGVIGCGKIAEMKHLPAYQGAVGVRILGIADSDPQRLKLMSDKFAVDKTYADYRDLIQEGSLDAVSICVPTYLHHGIAVAAAQKGKHILCEKPLALTSEEGKEMVGVARKNQVQLYVGAQGRFSSAVVEMLRLLRRGSIGRPVSVNYRKISSTPAPGSWYLSREKGGGALFDAGYHGMDFLLKNFGDGRISSASFERSSQGDVDIASKVSMQFDDLKALLEVRWSEAGTEEGSFGVEGERGVLSTDIPRSRVLVKIANSILGKQTNGVTLFVEERLPHAWAEIRKFIDSVKSGQFSDLLASGEDALKNLQTIEAAYRYFE